MGEECLQKFIVEERSPLRKFKRKEEDDIKIDLMEIF
jgi:hypothetical protein